MLKFFHTLLLISLLAATPAVAQPFEPFDRGAFDSLQKQGRPILVLVHADWCPICKAQEPIISELLKQPELRTIAALRVDFDRQKNVVKSFRVSYQSTLIVFKGGKEVARSTGDTDKNSIAALLKKAI